MPGFDIALADLLELTPLGASTYSGERSPEWDGVTYGGQLLAQGLAAARHTVDSERRVHSLHAYFLRAGVVVEPTRYHVDVVRDGRSFATRQVTAHQGERELFRMMLSFQVPEPGLDYEPDGGFPIASIPGPDETPESYTEFTYRMSGDQVGSWPGEARPMEIRYLDPPAEPDGTSIVRPQLMWLRAASPLPGDPGIHEAALAYLADSTLIDHVMLPHGHRWQDARLQGTSLDHAMWFHRPAQADEWLLYHQQVEATAGARGLATGRFYRSDGALVATCSQEGLMRWPATGPSRS